MSYIECLLVLIGTFSLVFGAGALVCVITDAVLKAMLWRKKREYRGKRRYSDGR